MIISRAEAKAQGLKRYYTGKTCLYGHDEERVTSSGTCVACQAERTRLWREGNREHISEYNQKWRNDNPGYGRQYYADNLEKERSRVRCYARNRREGSPQAVREYNRQWRESNADWVKKYRRKYAEKNLHVYRESQSRRRARKRNQVCDCCTPRDIRQVYFNAKMMGCEVDHVEPLALGGLHCRHNLQLLTPKDHKEKTRSDMARIADAKRSELTR